MPEIRHRVGIAVSPAEVYETLATPDGVSQWWTEKVTGDASVGGTLAFYFGGPEAGLEAQVVAATPGQGVTWRCVQGPADWVGTTIDFALTDAGEETVLLFSHSGWRDPSPFMAHCSTKWAYFLLGLKSLLEGGQAHPSPGDLALSGTFA